MCRCERGERSGAGLLPFNPYRTPCCPPFQSTQSILVRKTTAENRTAFSVHTTMTPRRHTLRQPSPPPLLLELSILLSRLCCPYTSQHIRYKGSLGSLKALRLSADEAQLKNSVQPSQLSPSSQWPGLLTAQPITLPFLLGGQGGRAAARNESVSKPRTSTEEVDMVIGI
jgi:hypothetical protein